MAGLLRQYEKLEDASKPKAAIGLGEAKDGITVHRRDTSNENTCQL